MGIHFAERTGFWTRVVVSIGRPERLKALRIRDQALREMLPADGRLRARARLVSLGLLGLVPALAGGALHYLPYRLTGAAGRATRDPTRIAAYRLGVAVVVFPLTYTAIALLLSRGMGWPAPGIVAGVAGTAVLGLHALYYFNWLARQWPRIRLVFLKASNRREVARLRRERRELIRMFDTALEEFRASKGSAG